MPEPVTITSDEEAEALARALAEYNARKAAEQAAARAAWLAPLREVIGSPEYQGVLRRLTELVPDYRDDPDIAVHLGPLPGFMERLRRATA